MISGSSAHRQLLGSRGLVAHGWCRACSSICGPIAHITVLAYLMMSSVVLRVAVPEDQPCRGNLLPGASRSKCVAARGSSDAVEHDADFSAAINGDVGAQGRGSPNFSRPAAATPMTMTPWWCRACTSRAPMPPAAEVTNATSRAWRLRCRESRAQSRPW